MREYHLQLIDRTNPKVKFPTYNMNPAWAKMWNMDFIRRNNLRYDADVVKGEGTLFTFTASYAMEKVRIIPEPLYGYRINSSSIMHRFSPDILEIQTTQVVAYRKVVAENGESDDEAVKTALHNRWAYLAENAISLGISHPSCRWRKAQRIEWAKSMLSLDWVLDSAWSAGGDARPSTVSELILKNDSQGLVRYCSVLRRRRIVKALIEGCHIGKIAIEAYKNMR